MEERYKLSVFESEKPSGAEIGAAHDLFKRVYKTKAGKKLNGLLFLYGVKRIRYALVVIQQEMNPRKDSALHHFKNVLSRMYPDIRVPSGSATVHHHKHHRRNCDSSSPMPSEKTKRRS